MGANLEWMCLSIVCSNSNAVYKMEWIKILYENWVVFFIFIPLYLAFSFGLLQLYVNFRKVGENSKWKKELLKFMWAYGTNRKMPRWTLKLYTNSRYGQEFWLQRYTMLQLHPIVRDTKFLSSACFPNHWKPI